MIRDRRVLWGLLAAAMLSVVALPFLLRADDPDLILRRRRIEGMTQAEREHLERNFQTYLKMNDFRRGQLQDFHASLLSDRVNNRGRINETLRVYSEWLQTVTPGERDALQRETEPTKRISMIRELVEDQRDERIEVRMGGRIEEFLGPIPDLSRDDLAGMLAYIDDRSGLYLSSQDELQEYEGIRRSLKMFELLARNGKTARDILTETNSRQLLAVIADEQTREMLETIPEGERPMAEPLARRMKLAFAMLKAIEGELDREHRQRQISPKNLSAFFEKLPVEEQDELLALTPDQFREQLLGKYVETEWSHNRINLTLVRRFFQPARPQGERPPADPRRRERNEL